MTTNDEMTWQIQIKGQVQGVGFRPFVWEVARQRGLAGRVSNGMAGVEICVSGQTVEVRDFYEYLLKNAPKGSKITSSALALASPEQFKEFSIQESSHTGYPALLLTPDVAICDTCRAEMLEQGNRRYHYAFTTCAVCGPRYSIQHALPYDRPNTSMAGFTMCPACNAEYDSPADRRFYAQTNSCPECGVQLQLRDTVGAPYPFDNEQIIQSVAHAWEEGKIVAVKGIGGYLLTCDATNAESVRTLRTRKHRPTKPFALLYPDETVLGGDTELPAETLALLRSPQAPIVLLELLEQPASGIALAALAPGLDRIGVMLPYAPLLELLAGAFGKPLVATSANFSGAPIAYREDGLAPLEAVADLFLTHNREIYHPQDDSVLALADQQALFLRRSRGYAPALLIDGVKIPPALALGAEMKSTFGFSYSGNLLLSQYLGDLSGFETQERFEMLLRRLREWFKVEPDTLLCDLHPGYFSSTLAEKLSQEWGIPVQRIQHHEAHFAAVLAENRCFEANKPVLGVIWDGTGLGHDGQVWGGEFFRLNAGKMERCAHVPYFPVLLGDKMAREPRLSSLALFGAEECLQDKFTHQEWALYGKMIAQPGALQCSSMGRVFDAIAALLGICDQSSFEGEAAMLLEVCARRYFRQLGSDRALQTLENEAVTPFSPHWKIHFLNNLRNGQSPDRLAATFHLTLVEWIRVIALREQLQTIAFSGGVFQNTLLVQLIRRRLAPDFQLLFHQQLSPNDENISFGQLAHFSYFNQS